MDFNTGFSLLWLWTLSEITATRYSGRSPHNFFWSRLPSSLKCEEIDSNGCVSDSIEKDRERQREGHCHGQNDRKLNAVKDQDLNLCRDWEVCPSLPNPLPSAVHPTPPLTFQNSHEVDNDGSCYWLCPLSVSLSPCLSVSLSLPPSLPPSLPLSLPKRITNQPVKTSAAK